jgi:hypothetical protein
MECGLNSVPDAKNGKALQARVEGILAAYAQSIRRFDLNAPRDQEGAYVTVFWKDLERADTIVRVPDETDADWEGDFLGQLNP